MHKPDETTPDRYMMATRAAHKTGDLSRDQPSLAIVYEETDENYIGQWAAGYGFFNVRFPKDTTRELTDAEKDLYRGKLIGLPGSGVGAPIQFDDQVVGDTRPKASEGGDSRG